ncbi:hypothetical protein B0J11DRAFT_480042 [Dendryphion nanum]|uniref:Uncharacterized protein n=1 Tax=Dendryphion nanum TaxID=256645 RepID=A0A9P9EEC2_9PLEO|nr:hypothetical protein B0J11DRAFT_480042 [Dendryphion nanum]
MAPTPRKSAPSTFAPTWHETDADFLNPDTLPVTKAPRAWDRKPETVKTRDGREKKVWRRYTTRSSIAANVSLHEEGQEEEEDSRYRAVKKLQRVRPDDMMTVAAPRAKRGAFKATRWDRRKSVLPRKKTKVVNLIDEDTNETSVSEEEGQDVDISVDSVVESEAPSQEIPASMLDSIVRTDRRRSTFTFCVEEISNERQEDNIQENVEQSAILSIAESSDKTTKDVLKVAQANLMGPDIVSREEEVTSIDNILNLSECQMDGKSEEAPTAMLEEEGLGVYQEHGENDEPISAKEEQVNKDPIVETKIFEQDEQPLQLKEVSSDINVSNEIEDADMSEFTLELDNISPHRTDVSDDTDSNGVPSKLETEDTLTEASLQKEILQEMELHFSALEHTNIADVNDEQEVVSSSEGSYIPNESTATISNEEDTGVEDYGNSDLVPDQYLRADMDDIAIGLTLVPSILPSPAPTTHRLRSPSPSLSTANSPDDVTTTIHLDDDTALLKDFLNRAAASKAEKTATIARRSSNQNRRDSDAIRQALASPRKALEEKDPNSPSKHDNDITLDLSQTLTLNIDQQLPTSPTPNATELADEKTLKSSRRSNRTRKSRLPAPLSSAAPSAVTSVQGPTSISVRRTDGGDPIVLKRTEAQEVGLVTRNNTRKNKQGAMSVGLRLLKLAVEAASQSVHDTGNSTDMSHSGKKSVRWDETLAYFQENPETVAEAESLATPDELSMSIPIPTIKKKVKESRDNNSTPRIRRVRGLGTTNGTPGKGLLAPATLLPDEIQDDKQESPKKPGCLPKAGKIKKLSIAPTSSEPTSTASPTKAAPLEVAPVGVEPTKERKSRLAQPKKVNLPQPLLVSSTIPLNGKENQQIKGIGGASPRKGLKFPAVVIPAKVESGLPRRRGVKKA